MLKFTEDYNKYGDLILVAEGDFNEYRITEVPHNHGYTVDVEAFFGENYGFFCSTIIECKLIANYIEKYGDPNN